MRFEGSDEEEELKIVPVVNNNNNINVVSDSDSDSSEEDVKNNKDNFLDEDIHDQVKIYPQTTVNSKVVQAMKKLQALYNEDANKNMEEATQDKAVKKFNFLIDLAMVTIDTMPVPEEPTTFAKAWNHPNASSHAKWKEAICKEFADMNKQKLWCKTTKTLIPTQQCVRNKWVFVIKYNGV